MSQALYYQKDKELRSRKVGTRTLWALKEWIGPDDKIKPEYMRP